VIIGDKEKTVVTFLHLDMLAHRPEVVAYVQPARRLNARKNSQNKTPFDSQFSPQRIAGQAKSQGF
jgi:hypothetical protein